MIDSINIKFDPSTYPVAPGGAVGFIKNFGLAMAKDAVELNPVKTIWIPDNENKVVWIFERSELKRLVEAHVLVNRYGDVEKAKEHVKKTKALIERNPMNFKAMCDLSFLEQAIADVEACQ